MKRIFLCLWLTITSVAYAAEKSDLADSVVDVFLSIPERYMLYSRDEREGFMHDGLVDKANGYIEYMSISDRFEFAIFKRKDGLILAAMSWWPGDCIDEAPETCESNLQFFLQSTSGWQPLGVSVLPRSFNKNLIYKLPKVGKDIIVMTQRGKFVERYEFNGLAFQVSGKTEH